MGLLEIKNITQATARYKIYTILCSHDNLENIFTLINKEKINIVNIGKEVAGFIENLEDYAYLNIDVFDYIKRLLEKNKSKIDNNVNEVLAIHNLGILLEPSLELNAAHLLKEFSKTTALIIIWENESDSLGRLYWATQQNNIFLDFTDTTLNKLQYAI